MSISAAGFTMLNATQNFPWDLPVAAIGYEGVAFTPPIPVPDAKPWAYITLLPVSLDDKLQTVTKDREILQIDLNGPMNQGTADLIGRRDALLSYFAPRRLFTFNGQRARVRSRSYSPWRTYGGWESIALSITFDAPIDRPFS